MSAFIVSKAHIDLLLTAGIYGPREGWSVQGSRVRWYDEPFPDEQPGIAWAGQHARELSHETADEVGQMLVTENVVSVAYRYSEPGRKVLSGEGWDDDLDLPGPVDRYWADRYSFRPAGASAYKRAVAVGYLKPRAVDALKAIRCYGYQACEHPGWHTSEASRFCDALQSALIGSLPGYADAPWEWNDDEILRAKAHVLGLAS